MTRNRQEKSYFIQNLTEQPMLTLQRREICSPGPWVCFVITWRYVLHGRFQPSLFELTLDSFCNDGESDKDEADTGRRLSTYWRNHSLRAVTSVLCGKSMFCGGVETLSTERITQAGDQRVQGTTASRRGRVGTGGGLRYERRNVQDPLKLSRDRRTGRLQYANGELYR